MSRCSCICWPMVVLLLAVHSARALRPTRQVPMAGGGATGGGIFWMAADPNAPNDLQMWPSAGGFGTAQQQQPQQMLMGQQPQQQMDWPSFSGYGQMTGAGGASVGQSGAQGMPASPYAAYLEKQIASYPVMIYTLADCIPCQRAKHLLATHYPDVRAHYLELSGNEPWQQQLQIDLQYLTGAITFPYIFVCGQYIGGASELFELHESGQLRRMVAQCLKPVPK